MSVNLIISTEDGVFETGSIADSDGKSYGRNQVGFEFYSDEACKNPVSISSGLITVEAKQSLNANYNSVPDGTDMDIAASDAPLRFEGVANFMRITKTNIVGANFIKMIIDKY